MVSRFSYRVNLVFNVPFKRILLVNPSGRKGLSFAFDLIPIGLEYIASYIEDTVEKVDIIPEHIILAQTSAAGSDALIL